MGVSYTAYSGIGMFVGVEHLVRTSKVPSCNHPNEKKAKFCAECGKKVEMISIKFTDLLDDLELRGLKNFESLGCVRVFEGDYETTGVIIGHIISASDYNGGFALHTSEMPDIEAIKTELQAYFNENGIKLKAKVEQFSYLYASF